MCCSGARYVGASLTHLNLVQNAAGLLSTDALLLLGALKTRKLRIGISRLHFGTSCTALFLTLTLIFLYSTFINFKHF